MTGPEQPKASPRQRWAAYHAEAVEPRIFVIRQLPLAGGWLLGSVALVNVVLGVLPIVFVLATSVLIGRVPGAVEHGLGSEQWDGLVTAFLVASATFLARQLLVPLVASLGAVMKHRVDGAFRERLIAVSLRATGIGVLENQDALQSLRQASEDLEGGSRSPGDAATGTLAYLARYTELVGYLVILGTVSSWPAAAAVAASTMCFRHGHRAGLRVWTRLWPVLGPMRRQREYFHGVGLRAAAAKELRVFGLTGWVVDRYTESALAALVPLWAERRRTNSYRFLWFTAVGLLVTGTVLALLVRAAARGELSLAELVLAMQAAIAATILGDYYHEADDRSQFGMLAARAMDDFDKQVTAYAGRDVDASATRDAVGLPTREIRFAGVSFSYDGAHRP
ncbi:MAG TPA: ABC transporter ATP-binding protein, partial [Catenuloplanes sp.]